MLLQNSTISTIRDADYSAGVSPTYSTTPCSPSIYNVFSGGVSVGTSPKPRKPNGSFTVRYIKNQETRGWVPSEFTLFFAKRDIFRQVNAAVKLLENADIKLAAEEILRVISNELDKHGNLSHFLPLFGFASDDGSFLIEWIFDDFRVGYNLEQNPLNSSWYLVSKVSSGGINASGFLHGIESQSLVAWLVSFVASQVA